MDKLDPSKEQRVELFRSVADLFMNDYEAAYRYGKKTLRQLGVSAIEAHTLLFTLGYVEYATQFSDYDLADLW